MRFPTVRVLLSVVVIVGAVATSLLWDSFSTPVRGSVAVSQIEDSDVDYAISKRFAVENLPAKVIGAGTFLTLAVIWGTFAASELRRRQRQA